MPHRMFVIEQRTVPPELYGHGGRGLRSVPPMFALHYSEAVPHSRTLAGRSLWST